MSLPDLALDAVTRFADLMLDRGRDRYGPKHSPLFLGQLNARTHSLPEGTPADPGLLAEQREVEGCWPSRVNLLFDFGWLDALRGLTAITGSPRYEAARVEHLSHLLAHCRHPASGYIPWGEHVGFDIVADEIRMGEYKRWHEVKVAAIPWDDLWAVNPAATRHEIEVAFWNHICDEATMTFNRHAEMDGRSNRGTEPCSLASSGGIYAEAWAWLFRRTGERKFLDRARAMMRLYHGGISPVTGLFCSSEDRPTELWYGDVLDYGCVLLRIAEILEQDHAALRAEAVALFLAYDRYARDPDGTGYFDTLDITTGKPVIGPSRHYPTIERPRHLETWVARDNSIKLVTPAITSGFAFAATGDEQMGAMFDHTVSLLGIPQRTSEAEPMIAGDVAGVILALTHAARRGRREERLAVASMLVEHALKHNVNGGVITSGYLGDRRYYSARAGCSDLAAALLAFAIVSLRMPVELPLIRQPLGALAW